MAGLRSRKPGRARRHGSVVVVVDVVCWPAKVVVVSPVELVLLLVVVVVVVLVVGVQISTAVWSSVLHVITAEHCEQHAA
jgi:hypothetical protein